MGVGVELAPGPPRPLAGFPASANVFFHVLHLSRPLLPAFICVIVPTGCVRSELFFLSWCRFSSLSDRPRMREG